MKQLLTILLIGVLGLAGCTREPPDEVCTASHTDMQLLAMPVTTLGPNNSMTTTIQMQWMPVDTCDASHKLTQEEKDQWRKDHQ